MGIGGAGLGSIMYEQEEDMGFVKADWAHTRATTIIRNWQKDGGTTSCIEELADALREAQNKGYNEGFADGWSLGPKRTR